MIIDIDEFAMIYMESRFPDKNDKIFTEASNNSIDKKYSLYDREMKNIISVMNAYRNTKVSNVKECKSHSSNFIKKAEASLRKIFFDNIGKNFLKELDIINKRDINVLNKFKTSSASYNNTIKKIISTTNNDNLPGDVKEMKIRDMNKIADKVSNINKKIIISLDYYNNIGYDYSLNDQTYRNNMNTHDIAHRQAMMDHEIANRQHQQDMFRQQQEIFQQQQNIFQQQQFNSMNGF